ncbi:MAG: F0F1 ATP synthase subunit B [Acidimicrobiales bacterium]
MLAASNFLVPNATFVVELVVFVVVLGVIAVFVVPPLKAAMELRQRQIEASVATAERADELLQVAEVAYQARLDEARREARAITETGERVRDHLREEGRQQGRQEHDRLVARAQFDIDRALAVAHEELRVRAAQLGIEEEAPSLLAGRR